MTRRQRAQFRPIATLKTAEAFAERLEAAAAQVPGVSVGFDPTILTAQEGSPLARPITVWGRAFSNRFAIHPTEGWDAWGSCDVGQVCGMPSPWTLNRWRGFGLSGAPLILGGEAFAVCADARANPNQMFLSEETEGGPEEVLQAALSARRQHFSDDSMLVGLQLTHSGQYCRPEFGQPMRPMPAVWDPVVGPRFGATAKSVVTDEYLDWLITRYVEAAKVAWRAGFSFVDLKHCHGYLLHQLLGSHTRAGRYGGSFENRTRFLRELVAAIRSECPGLEIMVRVSLFDHFPIKREGEAGWDGYEPHRFRFGVRPDGSWDQGEAYAFLQLCRELGLTLVSLTFGVPYYSSQIQRPADFFAADADVEEVDPLQRALEQMRIVQMVKRDFPNFVIVGTSYAVFQQWMPHVLQWQVREGQVDVTGISRAFIANPRLPHEVLQDGVVSTVCRTFSDCTSSPRRGYLSGCFPLASVYKQTGLLRDILAGRPNKDGRLPTFEALSS